MKFRFLPLIFFLFFSSLHSEAKEPIYIQKSNSHLTQKPDTENKPNPYDWNDFSKFLAGMQLSKDSQFYSLTQTKDYQKYTYFFNKSWKKIETKSIRPIFQWQKKFIPLELKKKTAVYLLSGVDFVNLYSFFPNTPYYIMVGLEPPGIPSSDLYQEASIEETLHSIQNLVPELSERNYFSRRKMENEFGSTQLPGVTPVLLAFMTRMGLQINSVSKVQMNEEGYIVLLKDQSETYRPILPKGVLIQFYDPFIQQSKTLVYLQMSLDSETVTPNSPKGKFFLRQSRFNVILKAAEYIFHEPKYQNVLRVIYPKMDLLIQDDSGIPYRMFDKEVWKIQVFGNYKGRIPLPRTADVPEQKELKTIFKHSSKHLPFPYGYGVLKGKNRSNLMLLIKKNFSY